MASIEISGATLKRLKGAHSQFCMAMGLNAVECPFDDFVLTLLLDGLADMEAATAVSIQAQKEGLIPGAFANVH